MLKRMAIVLLLWFGLSACAPFRLHSPTETPVPWVHDPITPLSSSTAAEFSSGATAAITTSAAKIPTTSEADQLKPIPMRVGIGVDGEWFQLFFTNPADPLAKERSGGPDQPLGEAIDAARLEVDVAAYSLNLYGIRAALLRAHRRGVQVRVVMESDNADSRQAQALKEAGIPLLGDRRESLMHNKFVVIDRQEVWTGSMNFTETGAYADNNNLICIHSEKLAQDYRAEFEEMYTGDRFGAEPGSVTPFPRLLIQSVPLDIYFSPDDRVEAALLDLLENAQSSIYFLAYSFTSDPLGEAIRRQAARGLEVKGVMEADQVRSNAGSEYDVFRQAGVDVRLDGNAGQMHHKVLVIDGQVVVTGSYNFTFSAETRNDENLIVIYDSRLASLFLREFQRIYSAAQP